MTNLPISKKTAPQREREGGTSCLKICNLQAAKAPMPPSLQFISVNFRTNKDWFEAFKNIKTTFWLEVVFNKL